ncbi:MAG: hypothetical protein HZA03_02655 [Nitrospinae bacterium]|nr:hypothetical protein [Nitrospinota bacterium]
MKPKTWFWSVIMLAGGVVLSVFTLNYFFDPFNFRGTNDILAEKKMVGNIMNGKLFSIVEFNHSPPVRNFIFGDSRSGGLNVDTFKNEGMGNFYNLSLGGGTLYEERDLFWWIASRQRIDSVVFSISFLAYTKRYSSNIIPEMVQLLNEPSKYYTSMFTAKSSFQLIRLLLEDRPAETNLEDKDKLWNRALSTADTMLYGYERPNDLYREFARIVAYCREHNIAIVLFIPPVHVDVQKRIEKHNLLREYNIFKNDMINLGPEVVDFDTVNNITEDRNKWADPQHLADDKSFQILTHAIVSAFKKTKGNTTH